jgi:aspartyl-tRNA(Asn)/glutamyl-tRNA(Gln) amidotransferase subunit B
MPDYIPVIGLEVHAELQTRSKMFCGCGVVDSTSAQPNSAVCEICTGQPGTLPVINRQAVEFALRVALALDCQVAERSVFARKNYFYPDLPKGFQISQYEAPLAEHGRLTYRLDEAQEATARIRRVHLEEDTGKLFHRDGYSLVDFNRSGVPLLEIVSEPDLHSVADVSAYAAALRSLLQYLEVNSGDMEKGVIRFEANVSLAPALDAPLGTRVEIKNLNSFRAMARAIEHEIARQTTRLDAGQPIVQETLGWDEARQVTVSQRGKEEAQDYRYFPEPDLPPLVVDSAWVDEIRRALPELPHAKRQRFLADYQLAPYAADVLTADPAVAAYFEAAAASSPGVPSDKLANWLSGELFGLFNLSGAPFSADPVSPAHLAELVEMVEGGAINATTAKDVLARAFQSHQSPRTIVEAEGLAQVSDAESLRGIVDQVLRDHPDQVALFQSGKLTVSQWFFGQVMRATSGQANPQVVRQELERALSALPTSPSEPGP